jgi:hypothetical protein
MPLLSRTVIRLAMLYLLLGLAGWSIATANQYGYIEGTWFALRPVSIHWITVGWLTQLIFAVIYWMFPIISRDNPYGPTWIAWAGFAAINIGLLLRAIFEIGLTRGMSPDLEWALVLAAALQWLGALAFVVMSWRRVRPRGGR